jgi:hypothetical protein
MWCVKAEKSCSRGEAGCGAECCCRLSDCNCSRFGLRKGEERINRRASGRNAPGWVLFSQKKRWRVELRGGGVLYRARAWGCSAGVVESFNLAYRHRYVCGLTGSSVAKQREERVENLQYN